MYVAEDEPQKKCRNSSLQPCYSHWIIPILKDCHFHSLAFCIRKLWIETSFLKELEQKNKKQKALHMKDTYFNHVDSSTLKYYIFQFQEHHFLTKQSQTEGITPIVRGIPAFQNLFW